MCYDPGAILVKESVRVKSTLRGELCHGKTMITISRATMS